MCLFGLFEITNNTFISMISATIFGNIMCVIESAATFNEDLKNIFNE